MPVLRCTPPHRFQTLGHNHCILSLQIMEGLSDLGHSSRDNRPPNAISAKTLWKAALMSVNKTAAHFRSLRIFLIDLWHRR